MVLSAEVQGVEMRKKFRRGYDSRSRERKRERESEEGKGKKRGLEEAKATHNTPTFTSVFLFSDYWTSQHCTAWMSVPGGVERDIEAVAWRRTQSDDQGINTSTGSFDA